MKYAIKRTNQITEENELYRFDDQRVKYYYNELEKGLDSYYKELLEEYRDHVLMREEKLILAVYIAAFEDAIRIMKNVGLISDLIHE